MNPSLREKLLLAGNPNTRNDILMLLASDNNLSIRRILSKNPSAPEFVLKILSYDSDWVIKYNILMNTSVNGSSQLFMSICNNDKMLHELMIRRYGFRPDKGYGKPRS